MTGIHQKVIWEDMDDVSALKQVCHDLYAAREAADLKSEEKLYQHLVSLYRDPAVLKEMTSKSLLHPEDALRCL